METWTFQFKLFLLVNFLTFPILTASSKPNALLVCLGQEELKLHKSKTVGPIYTLNQLFINFLSSSPDLHVKDKQLKGICEGKDFSPSVNLLRAILLHDKELYNFPTREVKIRKLQEGAIETLKERMPHIFFSYLGGLQALAPTHDCLNKNIRNLDYFMVRFRYLEGHFSAKEIMKDKKRITEMFEDLKTLDFIMDKCKQEAKKMEKIKNRSS